MCVECPFPIGEAKIRSNLQGQNTKGTHTCVESLFSVGEIDPSEKFPPVPEGAEIIGEIPEWLRAWFPFDSFVKATFEPTKQRVHELQSSGQPIGPDSPEADELEKNLAVAREIVETRKAVFSAGLKQHLFNIGKFEEGAVQVCEGWQIARVPMSGVNSLEALLLSALFGRTART